MPCCWMSWKKRSATNAASCRGPQGNEPSLHHAAVVPVLRLVFRDSPGAGVSCPFGRRHRSADRGASEAEFRCASAVRRADVAAGVGLFAVLAFCIPSYLWLEPQATGEKVGFFCVLTALMGITVWVSSLKRVADAVRGTSRYLHECERHGRRITVPGDNCSCASAGR